MAASMEGDHEDDRSSVGTDKVLGIDKGDSIVSTAIEDAKQEEEDWRAAALAAVPAAAAADDGDGLKAPSSSSFSMPVQPSSASSLLALEAALLAKYTAPPTADAAETRFMVDADWLRLWNGYLFGQQGCLPPGPLTNAALYDRRTLRLRQGLVEGLDYKAMTPTAFHVLAILYGTSDDGGGDGNTATPPEICRCVFNTRFSEMSCVGCDAHHGLTTPSTPPRRRHHYHSFGGNIYNAEVPPSKLRDVSREAKQRAHAEVNRMLARQRRRIVNGGIGPEGAAAAGGETTSIVSSCSSFQVAGARRGGRPGDEDAEEEEEDGQEDEDRARAARCV